MKDTEQKLIALLKERTDLQLMIRPALNALEECNQEIENLMAEREHRKPVRKCIDVQVRALSEVIS